MGLPMYMYVYEGHGGCLYVNLPFMHVYVYIDVCVCVCNACIFLCVPLPVWVCREYMYVYEEHGVVLRRFTLLYYFFLAIQDYHSDIGTRFVRFNLACRYFFTTIPLINFMECMR